MDMGGYALDPNMLVNALANKDDDNGLGGNGLLWIFLLILFWGGNGFGGLGRNGSGAVINDAAITGQIEAALSKAQVANLSDATILTAINGNKEAINAVASTLGMQSETIRGAIDRLANGICDLGYKMGQDTASIISNITTGNAALSRQLADCCCTTQRNIDSVRYDMATGFCGVNTNIDKSVCALERYIDGKIDMAQMENRAGFQGIRDYMTNEKISSLQNDLQAAQLTLSNTNQTQALKDYIASYFNCPPGYVICNGSQTSTTK